MKDTVKTIERRDLNGEVCRYMYEIDAFKMVDCETVYGYKFGKNHKVNMVFVGDVDKLVKHILKKFADIEVIN
jgi:hypothetical protein